MNIITIVGNAGREPELKVFDSGAQKVSFSIATDEGYYDKKKGEWIDQAQWHNIEVWGNRAEYLSKKIAKGTCVSVVGSMRSEKYENDKGETKYKWFVKAQRVDVLARGADLSESDMSANDNPVNDQENVPF
jgi:single-strand DNA-binding protein